MCDQLITGGGVSGQCLTWLFHNFGILQSQIDAAFRTTVNSVSYVGNIIVFAVTVDPPRL